MPYEIRPAQITLFKEQRTQGGIYPMYRGTGKDLNGNTINVSLFARYRDRHTPQASIAFYQGLFWQGATRPSENDKEPENGHFRLFINNTENEAAPKLTGNGIDLNGEKFRIAAWIKTTPTTKTQYLSCKITKQENAAAEEQEIAPQRPITCEEEIPF